MLIAEFLTYSIQVNADHKPLSTSLINVTGKEHPKT